MTVIGITGPTGAGKTTALRELEKLGGCVLDTDALYHELLESDTALQRELRERFGDMTGEDGRFDRKKLGIPLSKIHCITAQNHVVSVLTDQGEYRAVANFSQLQEALCGEPRFLACNRGVLVNMDKILRFGDETIEMRCGKRFPVRQRDKKRLFTAFTQYQFRHMRKQT